MSEVTTEAQKMSPYQRKAVGAATFGLGLQSMSTMLLSFVLVTMIADFGISKTAGGMISTVTNIGMLVGGLIFGPIADRFGRVKTLAVTVAIFSLATLATGFAGNIALVYVFRFLVGVGGGGEYGVVMSLVADAFSKERRGRHAVGDTPADKISIGELFTNGRASTTLRLMLMATVQVAGYFGLMNWLPSIIQKQAGLAVSGSSVWMTATIGGMILGMLLFGQLMDRVGPKWAYGSFLVASAIAVFIYPFAHSTATILIGGAIVGFFANGMNAGYGAIVGNLYPMRIRATANNIIFNIGRAVGGFSSVAIGFFLDHYTLTVAMGFLAILYILSFLTVLTLRVNRTGAAEE